MTVTPLLTMRNSAGAILTLLAFGIACPSSVQAGCRYAHGPAPRREAAHLELLALAGALPISVEQADSPAPKSPCAGMRCSNDSAPALPSTPAADPAAEQWGFLADLASRPELASSPFPFDDPAVRARHCGASLFHPPR